MKIRVLSLLLMGSIVSSVMLGSCSKKDDDNSNYGPDYSQPSGEFKDSRDGKVYKWVKIGTQIWMAENLAYTGSGLLITDEIEWSNNTSFDGWCYYDNDENNGDTYGILYQWEAAKSACPPGWHLPTDVEWQLLEEYIGNDGHAGNEGAALKTTSGWFNGGNGTDDYGFSALPAGKREFDGPFISSLGEETYWWSATEYELNNNESYFRQVHYNLSSIQRNRAEKLSGFSVRCIKD